MKRLVTAWPLSALEVWVVAWAGHAVLSPWGREVAFVGGALLGAMLALLFQRRWRRLIAALGFPVSTLLLGWQGDLAAWLWLVPVALLWWLYPRRSWSEAPLFPTPRGALARLPAEAPLCPDARVLDAGCGVGDGLRELLHAYPQARVEGVEWSRPLALLARWRARGAVVRRGDLWADDWAPFALVYVFQRPESMPRIWAKACAELAADAWLASLDFQVPDVVPAARWQLGNGQFVWLYRPARKAAPNPAN
nr:class I SAM-dependent methyltransferase [Pelomonas sp. P8]